MGVDPHPALGQKVFAPDRRHRARAGTRSHFAHEEDFFTRIYRRFMGPLIAHPRWRWLFLGSISACCSVAMALVAIGWVKVKMLPFDNKSEFQVILNMPEGSALERTAQAAREIAAAVRTEPEVTDYQIYAGRGGAVQFQRPGAPLLHAPRRECGGHPGQLRRQR